MSKEMRDLDIVMAALVGIAATAMSFLALWHGGKAGAHIAFIGIYAFVMGYQYRDLKAFKERMKRHSYPEPEVE